MESNKPQLLVVEDDQNLGEILSEYLDLKGYKTTLCRDGVEGLKSFKSNSYDFCIFDIMMPKKDGFTLAKEVREIDEHVPIVFLTAKSMKTDIIEGLKLGADDYLTKPFSMEELLLRINSIRKRAGQQILQPKIQKYNIGKFEFDVQGQNLSSEYNTRKLTSKESQLLELLVKNVNRTLNRSEALKLIWKDDTYFNARSMDVYITKLRKILKEDSALQILTIHGQGFRLVTGLEVEK
ncbi:MAG: response regulator transcription factor [Bacteroidota bacterium]